MNGLTKQIKEALQLREATVEIIHPLGGMTNINYLISINEEKYIARFAGNGTEDFINRIEEKDNLELATVLGINPEHIYFNVKSGMKITRKIVNAKTLTPELAKDEATMKKTAHILRKLHGSEIQMNNRFELNKLMAEYERLALDAQAIFYKDFKNVKKDIIDLKAYYQTFTIKEVPCHIDPTFPNFIYGQDHKLYLIDWEYSGMFDPLWDIAAYMLESGFTIFEEDLFLSYYFERAVTQDEWRRIHLHKIFQDYLWSLWTLFKEEKGDEFGTYGSHRFMRARENIVFFRNTYCAG